MVQLSCVQRYTPRQFKHRVIRLDFFIFASEQWLLLSIFLLLVYGFIWRETSKGGQSISYHQLTRLVNKDEAFVVDLRDAKEFAAGRIAGAVNIPSTQVKERLSEFEANKDKTIVLVDKLGQTTGTVGRELGRQGFTINRLSGGMAEWTNEKLPVVKDAKKETKKDKKDGKKTNKKSKKDNQSSDASVSE